MLRRTLLAAIPGLMLTARPGVATPHDFTFRGITGETLSMATMRGGPVLVVNTASKCGFTRQYADLQALHERYGTRGLTVLAVPSNDFRQELATDQAVAEFCEVNFGLGFAMTGITSVRGTGAHPFYAWLAREHDIVPQWNFTKVLLDGRGAVVGAWGPSTRPTARPIRQAIEAALRG